MQNRPMINRQFFVVLLVAAVVSLATACGSKVIRGNAPIVRITELSHTGTTISLQLSMRNLNGISLDIQSIDFSLSVEDNELFSYKGPAATNIVANGTETWTVEVEEGLSGKQLLDKLQGGEVVSLPYSLKGSITAADEGKLRFTREGHLYPVPGRPGHFR